MTLAGRNGYSDPMRPFAAVALLLLGACSKGDGTIQLAEAQSREMIRDTIKVLDGLGLAPADMEKICYRNAQELFGIA